MILSNHITNLSLIIDKHLEKLIMQHSLTIKENIDTSGQFNDTF